MGENTKIEWADDSINIWWGCQRHGTGCKNCYAESLASRFHPKWKLWGNDVDSVRLYMPKWEASLRRLNAKAEKAGKADKGADKSTQTDNECRTDKAERLLGWRPHDGLTGLWRRVG